ncbi:MAG TPA: hypothetical protein VHE36_04460 [Sphingomicrobium sp.]|nr:hypothetical protein [Sphingomicrobium sp.]
MRMMLGVAAALLLGTGMAAAKDRPADPPDKVICKRVYDADTGSHFTSSKRICHTAAEWKEIQDDLDRTLRQVRDNSGLNPNDIPPSMGGRPQ